MKHASHDRAGDHGPAARAAAAADLRYLEEVLERARRRIDPHSFHDVHWGLIVLLWFPVGNWLAATGRMTEFLVLGIAAIGLGTVLGMVGERRLARQPRIGGADEVLARKLLWVVVGTIVPGIVLSAVGGATGLLERGEHFLLWGFVYAVLAWMSGVLYHRDFMVAGAFIFAGSVVACFFPDHSGYILGPVMGLGMLVPGLRAERRVRALAREDAVGASTA
ncbi:MAG: hypothetical protein R3F30_04040 [Planctomycetota bacterium]